MRNFPGTITTPVTYADILENSTTSITIPHGTLPVHDLAASYISTKR
jgi:hypothetical protein